MDYFELALLAPISRILLAEPSASPSDEPKRHVLHVPVLAVTAVERNREEWLASEKSPVEAVPTSFP